MQRAISVLEHIISYCDAIEKDVERFGNSFEAFKADPAYMRSCSMSIMQIGELSKLLRPDFREKYNMVPWDAIRGMRNLFAHGYWKMDEREIWLTVTNDITPLKTYCERILEELNDNPL